MEVKKADLQVLFERGDMLVAACDRYEKHIQAYKDVLTILHPRQGVWVTPTDSEEKLIESILSEV